jgi:hypothetical protein
VETGALALRLAAVRLNSIRPHDHRMFALSALVELLFNIAFYGLIFVLSLYFQKVGG